MKNLLRVPLTKAKVSLLAHGLNFAIASTHSPLGEYTATVEQACLSLEPYEAGEFRAEIREAVKHSDTPRTNIIKEVTKALKELTRD